MSIESALAQGRAIAESRMTDTCQIGIESNSPVLDPDTGEYVPAFTVIYEGKCEFKAAVRLGSNTEVATQILFTQNAILKLPIATSTAVEKNHVVRITASQTDPGLVGTKARITGPFAETFATCRRMPVEVVN